MSSDGSSSSALAPPPPADPNYPEQRTPFRIVGVQLLYDRPLPQPITRDDWLPEVSRILDRDWVRRINEDPGMELVYDCYYPVAPAFKPTDLSGTMVFETAFGPDKLTRWTTWARKPEACKTEEERSEMLTVVRVGRKLGGHHEVLHGGFTATLLDDALGVTAYRISNATPSMTGTLSLKYLGPIPLPSVILIRSRCVRQEGRKMHMAGSVHVEGAAKPVIEAEGVWINLKEQQREARYGKRAPKRDDLVRGKKEKSTL
ncbi:HotDog domain-containing protein [Hyaloraphidium curvatum]|nr:HotDog domain-containing protein [Hyaloraphidium curvatum]